MSLRGSAAMPIHVDNGWEYTRYRDSLKKDLQHALLNFHEPLSSLLISSALTLWLERRYKGIHSTDEPALLCHTLSHHYSNVDEEGLSEETLEEDDLEIVLFLNTLTVELPFEIYLASLTVEEDGEVASRYGQSSDPYGDESDDDDDESWHSFDSNNPPKESRTYTSIFALDGSNVELQNDGALFDKMCDNLIIQGSSGAFQDAEQWEINLDATWRAPPGSRRGMDPPTATHCYRSAMLILVPRDEVEAFKLGKVTRDKAAALVPKYIADCSFPEKRASALKTLAFLARTLWSYAHFDSPDPTSGHSELGPLLTTTALTHRGYGLFNTVLRLLSSRLDPAELIPQLRLAASQPAFRINRISHSLLAYLGLAEISAGCRALTDIKPYLEAAPHMLVWVTGTVSPAYMERCRTSSVGSLDGTELVRFIKEYHNLDYFKQTFVPVLLLKGRPFPFALAALDEFASTMIPLQELANHPVYIVLASAVIASLDLPALIASNSTHHAHCLARLLTRPPTLPPTTIAGLLATLTQHATLAPPSQIHTFGTALLHALLPAHDPLLRPLKLAILARYLTSVVGPAPTPGDRPDYHRPPVYCADHCPDCQKLNSFLISRVMGHMVFAPQARNREHFKIVLKGLRGCTVTKMNRASSASGFSVTKKVKAYEARKAAWEQMVKEGRRVLAWEGVEELLANVEGGRERVLAEWGTVGL